MTDLIVAASTDEERWVASLCLVGEWLMEHSGNTRSTYGDSIGWPYTITGKQQGRWRGYTNRGGLTWLGWCHSNGVHLFDANRIHVLAWIDRCADTSLSKRSRVNMVSAASSFYIWATQNGHTETNPVALISRRKKKLQTGQDPSPTRSLSENEAKAMVRSADNDPVRAVRLRSSAIIMLLFGVGPRVGEICNATLADMRVQDGGRVLHCEVKGGKRHDYALPPEVCQRIDAYLASRDDINRLPARRNQTSASTIPLFATASGRPVGRGEVCTLVKRIAKLAGLDDPQSVHPHVGRHTYITEARRLNYGGDDIQYSVGHRDRATTDKYGTHIINLEKSPAYGVAARFAS